MEYIRVLPKKSLSRVVGKLAAIKKPKWLVEHAKSWFINRYHLNMSEAERPLHEYKSLREVFTRRLKAGARPIGEGLVHPCDGELTRVANIEEGELIQAKAINYSLEEFIKDPAANEIFLGGTQMTYYLCPTDYHRVHIPIDGEVTSVTHIPGELWPVNPWSVENVSQLFCRNERVVFRIQSALGPIALVMVGATNVGEILVSFDKDIRTNVRGSKQIFRKAYKPAVKLSKGEELGVFCMGSSVVAIYPKGLVSVAPKVGPVRLGESV